MKVCEWVGLGGCVLMSRWVSGWGMFMMVKAAPGTCYITIYLQEDEKQSYRIMAKWRMND